MALEVEEARPSFFTDRIRTKVPLQDGPATQHKLDCNAPLLSVRRLTDPSSDKKRRWKLSGELSKEPLRVPGTVPFTWEQTPGRPKLLESPPPEPSSPSPPSTPSPPSARRVSPASPTLPSAPPPLRPLFFRSESSTLFAPPPPPPPPPPPVSRTPPFPLGNLRRKSPHAIRPLSLSASAPSPPPVPPATHTGPPSHIRRQVSAFPDLQHLPDHERMGAFRLVDPTDGFLRLLQARRRKAEPEEFLAAEDTEAAAEVSHKDEAAEEAKVLIVAPGMENSSCGAVDAIVQRFLVEHPDAGTEEEEASEERQAPEWDQASLDALNLVSLPQDRSKHDAEQGEGRIADAKDAPKEDAACSPIVQAARLDEAPPETQTCILTLPDSFATDYGPSPTHGEGVSEQVTLPSSSDPQQLRMHARNNGVFVKKQQSRRRTGSIAMLDACRADSLQMIKSALLQLCRKAAAASIRTLAKAKETVYISGCASHSLDVVVHASTDRQSHEGGRSSQEEEAVAREEKMVVAETEHHEVPMSVSHSHLITPPRSSTDTLQESSENHPCNEMHVVAKWGRSPTSSPKPVTRDSPLHETHKACEKGFSPSLQQDSWNGERSCDSIASPKLSSKSSPSLETNDTEKKDILFSSAYQSPNGEGSPGVQFLEREERVGARPRGISVRHVYAKSLGGDEPNEFYDALSRFGSRGSTPTRLYSNRSMSREWSIPDDFLDATSSPFETPRTSVSDIMYGLSSAELNAFSSSTASRTASTSRQTSKLSKRVGKSLWVDTRETNSVGDVDIVSNPAPKRFISGELFSKESDQMLNRKEVNGTRRKWVSGDQASTSASAIRRQYRRDVASRRSYGGNSIAVTPLFPSKCQKNRTIASPSGLPQQMETVDLSEMGWPLGISGLPPLKINTNVKEEKKEKETPKGEGSVIVPLPPLPPSPAGGSWLRRALSSTTPKRGASSSVSLHKKVESSSSQGNKWEDIVKGSHVQPGHLRFSEELQHHTRSISTSNKYYVS